MRRAALLAVALAAAGGCGERPDGNMTAEDVAAELADMRIEPGLWALSTEVVSVSAPDLPVEVRNRMVGPRRSLRHCITPAQAADPGASFLALRADSDCRYRNFSFESERMRGTMVCPDVVAEMDGRYGPDAYDLRMVMESPVGGGATMTLQLSARGRRIGECEEEKAP